MGNQPEEPEAAVATVLLSPLDDVLEEEALSIEQIQVSSPNPNALHARRHAINEATACTGCLQEGSRAASRTGRFA
jgi:hypothetical protein